MVIPELPTEIGLKISLKAFIGNTVGIAPAHNRAGKVRVYATWDEDDAPLPTTGLGDVPANRGEGLERGDPPKGEAALGNGEPEGLAGEGTAGDGCRILGGDWRKPEWGDTGFKLPPDPGTLSLLESFLASVSMVGEGGLSSSV